jgi:hypothetical protein
LLVSVLVPSTPFIVPAARIHGYGGLCDVKWREPALIVQFEAKGACKRSIQAVITIHAYFSDPRLGVFNLAENSII